LDLAAASRSTGRQIDGLLGADFFRDKVVQVDYPARLLRINPSLSSSRAAETLPIQRNFGAMCVSVQIDGITLPKVRVDTGNTGGLQWSRPSAKTSAYAGTVRSVGLTNHSVSKAQGDLRLGSTRIPRVDQTVFSKRLFPGEDGLLGNTVLKQFTVTFDMKRQRLILDPN